MKNWIRTHRCTLLFVFGISLLGSAMADWTAPGQRALTDVAELLPVSGDAVVGGNAAANRPHMKAVGRAADATTRLREKLLDNLAHEAQGTTPATPGVDGTPSTRNSSISLRTLRLLPNSPDALPRNSWLMGTSYEPNESQELQLGVVQHLQSELMERHLSVTPVNHAELFDRD